MAPTNPSIQTEVENLELSISAIDNQISKLYNDFQASKKTLLRAAESSDLIHDYNTRVAEIDRLRSDGKYKDREIGHLQTEIDASTKKVKKLESELAEKNELLSRIGAFANNKSDDSPFPSKRAPSPSAESGDHRRKFGRYDNGHTYNSPPNQHHASCGNAHQGQHRQTVSSDNRQPKPVLDELRRNTFNPPVTRKVEDYLAEGRGETSDYGRDLNIPNGTPSPPLALSSTTGVSSQYNSQYMESNTSVPGIQSKKPFRPRVRRLVCHHCWQQRLKCDNGFTCQQCEAAGTKCVRTLCKWYHTPEGCNRPTGYCFKIHGEKGYETTDFDPFAKNPPPPPPPEE